MCVGAICSTVLSSASVKIGTATMRSHRNDDAPGQKRRGRLEDDQQERPDISVEAKTKVWIEHHGHFVMGDGGLHLLRAIRERGSLTLAARDVGWSYRHAWEYIRRAERVLGVALTGAVPGKGMNRGSALTPYGLSILETLAALRERIDNAVGALGPTAEEVAARGRSARQETTTRSRRSDPASAITTPRSRR